MNAFIERPAGLKSIAHRRLVYGIGINDADYVTFYINEFGKGVNCPFYTTWKNMLKRCYSEKTRKKYPTYKECTVCDEWLLFSNFRLWMEAQEWIGLHLDKDIIGGGEREYSPEFCAFIPRSLNNLLLNSGASRGKHPLGVYLNARSLRFVAQYSINGNRKHLGCFNTAREAEFVYKAFKSALIRSTAKHYRSDERIYNGLILAAQRLEE